MIAQRLEQDRPVAVDQSGKRHHRVDCVVRRLALRPLYEVHVHHFVRHEAGHGDHAPAGSVDRPQLETVARVPKEVPNAVAEVEKERVRPPEKQRESEP